MTEKPAPRVNIVERALYEVIGALRSIANELARSQTMDGLDSAAKVRGRANLAERILGSDGG